MEERLRGVGPGREVCAGAWTQGKQCLFVHLTRAQAQAGAGVLPDCGFSGELVMGTRRESELWKISEGQKGRHDFGFRMFPMELEDVKIRFGGGSASAIRTWRILIRQNGKSWELTASVVGGALPALLGAKAWARMGLWATGEYVFQTTRGEEGVRHFVVGSYDSHVPLMVLGQDGQRISDPLNTLGEDDGKRRDLRGSGDEQ